MLVYLHSMFKDLGSIPSTGKIVLTALKRETRLSLLKGDRFGRLWFIQVLDYSMEIKEAKRKLKQGNIQMVLRWAYYSQVHHFGNLLTCHIELFPTGKGILCNLSKAPSPLSRGLCSNSASGTVTTRCLCRCAFKVKDAGSREIGHDLVCGKKKLSTCPFICRRSPLEAHRLI